MPRVKRGTKRNDRRKKILKRASGYFLTKSKLYQAAQEAVERGLKFAYIGWTARSWPILPSMIRPALPR
jgi:large subunit ribosomal protein L20